MNSGQDGKLQAAVAHFQAGRVAEAKGLCAEILDYDPQNIMVLHLHGILHCVGGDMAKGATLIAEAVHLNPKNPAAHYDLGKAWFALGRLEDAVAAFGLALGLKPDFAEVHNDMGNVMGVLGRPGDAVAAYERALQINPNFAEAHNNLGNALMAQGRLADAAAAYGRALAINPKYAEAHYNRGNLHHAQGDLEDALAAYEEALALRPNYDEALNNLGSAFQNLGRFDEARTAFDRLLHLRHGGPWWNAASFDAGAANGGGKVLNASAFKLADAIDQIDYLISRGRIDGSFEAMAERYRSVLIELAESPAPETSFELNADQGSRIGAFHDRVFHYNAAPRIAGRAINQGLDFRGIEDEYRSSAVSVISINDFLTPEALSSLRDFCLESTIFFDYTGERFVSSRSNQGFNCDLLYQMAEELKESLPGVLGGHALKNMWVYRYNNQSEGVAEHTDDGAVTFNFWITPDDANLSPGGGGLVVYVKEQPMDWDWERYNREKYGANMKREIDEFLSDAKTMTIPYGDNRAVLFRSNLYHKSDQVNFKDGFENRRMNITMLFGHRGS
ncbi:MAG: tetratricopeptide repeat protein [Alphaproteobacteria bacterium]